MLDKYISWREDTLAKADDDFKSIEPIQLGLDLLVDKNNLESFDDLQEYVRAACDDTSAYFALPKSPEFAFDGSRLQFKTPLPTDSELNNTCYCNVFESRKLETAVVVLPSWNSTGDGFDQLSRFVARFGTTAVRVTLPYHEGRRPAEKRIADGLVSANLGRTIQSIRQAVLEVRLVLSWLESQGYKRIGIVGASIGTAVAVIVAAHDNRVRSAAFMLLASDFAETVWTGRATLHIRQALEEAMSLDEIKSIWKIISPISFVDKLREKQVPILIISGRRDSVFRPPLTRLIVDALRNRDVEHSWHEYACGHYTLATYPFKVFALFRVLRFLRRTLR